MVSTLTVPEHRVSVLHYAKAQAKLRCCPSIQGAVASASTVTVPEHHVRAAHHTRIQGKIRSSPSRGR